MGLLDSNRVIITQENRKLATDSSIANIYSIKIVEGKKIKLYIKRTGSGSLGVSINGTNRYGISGNWLTSSFADTSIIVNNKITVSADRTELIASSDLMHMDSVQVTINSIVDCTYSLQYEYVTIVEEFVEENINYKYTTPEVTVEVVDKYNGATNFAAFENWKAYVINNTTLYIEQDDVLLGSILLTDLPSWKVGDTIGNFGFIPYKQGGRDSSGYSRETSVRLCFLTANGNIYHNFAAKNSGDTSVWGALDFDLGAIYYPAGVLSTERIPTRTANLTVDQQRTHRTYHGLPEWNYQQHTGNIGGNRKDGSAYGNGGHPATLIKGGDDFVRFVHPFDFGTNPQGGNKYKLGGYLSEPFAVKSKCTVCAPYVGVNAKRNIVLGTVDGGRTWVVLHELGIGWDAQAWGNSLDLTSCGAYVANELSISIRGYIYPTNETKEPTNAFRYGTNVNVTAIECTGGKTYITTATEGLVGTGSTGYACFKSNSSGNFSWMANNDAATSGESNTVGNGLFFALKKVADTKFELLQCMGGVEEKINTHHIHSATATKDGVAICCGEMYPLGWLCYVSIPQIDDFASFDVWSYRKTNKDIIRLTSGDKSVQRVVGFILHDDKEQSYVYGSDTAAADRGNVVIDGRTNTFKRASGGIFKGSLSKIDDASSPECMIEMQEACLGVINSVGLTVALGMSRNTYVTPELGNKSKTLVMPEITIYVGSDVECAYLLSSKSKSVLKIRRR